MSAATKKYAISMHRLLALTTTAAVSKDWAATRLVTPKSPA